MERESERPPPPSLFTGCKYPDAAAGAARRGREVRTSAKCVIAHTVGPSVHGSDKLLKRTHQRDVSADQQARRRFAAATEPLTVVFRLGCGARVAYVPNIRYNRDSSLPLGCSASRTSNRGQQPVEFGSHSVQFLALSTRVDLNPQTCTFSKRSTSTPQNSCLDLPRIIRCWVTTRSRSSASKCLASVQRAMPRSSFDSRAKADKATGGTGASAPSASALLQPTTLAKQ